MIKGTYIIYEDGKEIYRSPNIITKFGKRYLTNLVAGNILDLNKDIAIGIDSTTPTANDTRLGFEFYRLPVKLRSIDIQQDPEDNTIFYYSTVFKTTIPQDVSGTIKEIGLYPSTRTGTNSYDDKFLTDFANPLDWKDTTLSSPQVVTLNPRIGDILLMMTSQLNGFGEYKTDVTLDISGYSINDTLTLAYRENDTALDYLQVRLYSSDTSYYYVQVEGSTAGDKIAEIPLSDLFSNSVGTPNKSAINKIGIRIVPESGTSTVSLDGLRINDEDTFDPFYGLISRSVLSSPLLKLNGRQVDIEYKLDLDF